MPGFELPDLTEDTSPSYSDIGYTVKDPTGSPLDHKATWLNILKGAALGVLTTNGDLFTRAAGALTRITRSDLADSLIADTDLAADLAANAAFTGAYAIAPKATRAYLSGATQSLTSATVTVINLDGETFDDSTSHFTSAANLTGTVAKTAASATLTGTGTAFTTELSVGQVISVPGTAAEWRVVTAIASNTSLTVNSSFANSASGQTATRINGAITAMVAGRYRSVGQVEFTTNATSVRLARIMKNAGAATAPTGTLIGTQTARANGSVNDRVQVMTGTIALAQWDYVSLLGFQDSGGALNVANGEYSTWLTLERVS